MEQRQIIRGLFVPADQESAKPVHPRMRPFHDPAACFGPGFGLDRFGLSSTRANVGGKAELVKGVAYFFVVVALRQTHPLGLFLGWLRTLDDDAFDRWAHELHVMTLRSLNRHADRHSMPFSEQVAFHSTLAPKSRDWGRLFPHPMELWSMPHPYSASPSRARTAHQTARLLLARV